MKLEVLHASGHAAAGASLFGLVGDHGLRGEEQGCDRRCVLQRRSGDLGGIDDAGLDQVLVLTGGGVEALGGGVEAPDPLRSEEQTSELQSLMRISYAVFCLKTKIKTI